MKNIEENIPAIRLQWPGTRHEIKEQEQSVVIVPWIGLLSEYEDVVAVADEPVRHCRRWRRVPCMLNGT